ncbi:MAG: antitoxin HicB [Candidatus Latescibacterota bacterium]|jgi:antitoxin HicB
MSEEFKLHLQITKVENGEFLATSDILPGLIAQGRTISETAEIAQDVARKLIESYRDHNDPHHSGDMPEGTLSAILKQADVTTEEFLGA